MLARRDIHLGQPLLGKIATVSRLILTDVARDIGQLEGEAQVAGAIERRAVAGIDPHQHRHHATDRACDMIAIEQHVGFAPRTPVAGVEREPLYQIMGIALGDGAFPHHDAETVKGWIAGRLPAQRHVGQDTDS